MLPEQLMNGRGASSLLRFNRMAAHIWTFQLAAVGSFALTLGAYMEAMRATRVAVVMIVLLALHLFWRKQYIWRREFKFYALFVAYMTLALLWTRDVALAMNTLVPSINCLLIMIFFGSLVRFHDTKTVLAGVFTGFIAGAALYTATQGFPFSYPDDFSYNAIAGMYLFGLFVVLMLSCFSRSTGLLLSLAVVIMLHVVATTSIKANLGVALGMMAAAIMYLRHFGRLLRRRILVLVFLTGALGFAVASNDSLIESMDRGLQRVMLGVEVLQAREDLPGYSAFEERGNWQQFGIAGWKQNPVFGYGTEAFRDDYGITSHSTPIDLLYNFGLIGMVLFYGVFASLIWRLLHLARQEFSSQRALILAGLVCYAFISLSGTMHYNGFWAAFVGISSALLIGGQFGRRTSRTDGSLAY